MNTGQVNLDQALISAQAAMLFALGNWTQFQSFISGHLGRCPVGFGAMQSHAIYLGSLCDPTRMPEE